MGPGKQMFSLGSIWLIPLYPSTVADKRISLLKKLSSTITIVDKTINQTKS